MLVKLIAMLIFCLEEKKAAFVCELYTLETGVRISIVIVC